MKWGEYSSDVQFILQRSEAQKTDNTLGTNNNNINSNNKTPFEPQQPKQQQQQPHADQKASHIISSSVTAPTARSGNLIHPNIGNAKNVNSHLNNLNVNNNVVNSNNNMNINNNISNADRKSDLVGIVKGVQKQNSSTLIPKSPPSTPPSLTDGNESIASTSSASASIVSSPQSTPQKPMVIEFNSADVRSSLDRKTNALRNAINLSNESLDENFNVNGIGGTSPGDLFKNCPPISSNGALAPPPYRNPPQPRNSPPTISPHSQINSMAFVHHQKSDSLSSSNSGVGSSGYRQPRSNKFDFLKEMTPPPLSRSKNGSFKGDLNCNVDGINDIINDNVLQNAQFRDLMQLIKYQRDKISSQQADITKVSSELDGWLAAFYANKYLLYLLFQFSV